MGVELTTCKIARPEPQVLFDRYLQMFSNNVLGGAAVIPESNEWYAASVNYAIAEEFYAITEQAWKANDPREACCDDLVAMAAVDGVYPMPATFAQGYVTLTGTAGAALPSPLAFSIGGLDFTTADVSQQPLEIGDNGMAVIRVRALTAGTAGNLATETGTLVTSVTDVDRAVTVCGGSFCQGAESEDCEAFRARYLRRMQYSPRATNQWILDKLLSWPCATRAIQRAGSCCSCGGCGDGCEDCGCKDCGGSIAFYVMFDNSFECGIAPASLIAEIEAWMFGTPQGYGLGQVEIGVCGRIVPVTGVKADLFLDMQACPTSAQLTQIRETIAEFFTTTEPSQPVRKKTIEAIVYGILGIEADVDARLELTNPEDGYSLEQARTADSKVFVGCDLEPDCDFHICLNSILINSPGATLASCP